MRLCYFSIVALGVFKAGVRIFKVHYCTPGALRMRRSGNRWKWRGIIVDIYTRGQSVSECQ